MTAQATSLVVDILGGRNRGLEFMERWRKAATAVVAVVTWGCVLLIDALCSDNVLNMTYDIASYSYGPLLGLFAFGFFTSWRVRDSRIPFVALAAPIIGYGIERMAALCFGYEVGFELLVVNAAITFAGLCCSVSKK